MSSQPCILSENELDALDALVEIAQEMLPNTDWYARRTAGFDKRLRYCLETLGYTYDMTRSHWNRHIT